jgi:hypothetical protein
MYSHCLCILIEDFGEAMEFWAKINPVLVLDAKGGENKGQSAKWISYQLKEFPVLVLDAKGGENKGQSDKWISYQLREFENSRIEILVE